MSIPHIILNKTILKNCTNSIPRTILNKSYIKVGTF
ncbi:hypothetical protein [Staphylococcus phage PT1-4]